MIVKYAAEWREPVTQFEEWYLLETEPTRQNILQVFYLLRQGRMAADVARACNVAESQIRSWLSQYRQFGIGKVLGYVSRGRLSIEQQMLLSQRSREVPFASVRDAMNWVEMQWGINYSYNSMRSILQVLDLQTQAQLVNQPDRRADNHWNDNSTDLWRSYQNESNGERRNRLLALYMLRRGIKLDEVTRRVAIDRPLIEQFLATYREQGLEAV